MNMGTVSVIIPIYNVEKYLSACVDSVLEQTYPELQIILVDDGSTDRSGEICDAYAQKDDRVTVIHQENAGPSAARNKGILRALGEYIAFVDSDDKLYPSAVQNMVDSAVKSGADLVFGGYLDQSPYGEFEIYEFNSLIDTREKLIATVTAGTGGVLWAKLFRTEIIAENGIRLNPQVHFSEDMLFILEYIQYVQKWESVQIPVYRYNRLNEGSLTRRISESLITSYAVFAAELETMQIRLGIAPEKAAIVSTQKIVGFVDVILRGARYPQKIFEAVRKNNVLYTAIQSGNTVLPKSIQYAMQNKWCLLFLLKKSAEWRARLSIMWHGLIRMKTK